MALLTFDVYSKSALPHYTGNFDAMKRHIDVSMQPMPLVENWEITAFKSPSFHFISNHLFYLEGLAQ